MPLPRARRLSAWGFLLLLSMSSAGCPELNRWSGPSQDPFFSVVEPVREKNAHVVARPMVQAEKDGGLSSELTERASARH